jgi:hypothetical protein
MSYSRIELSPAKNNNDCNAQKNEKKQNKRL